MRTVLRSAIMATGLGLALTTPALGQLRAGLVAGATYSKLTGDFLQSSDYRWNWLAGGYLELPYRSNLSLQLELNYVKKGGKSVTDNAQAIDLDVGYVEVPLLANFLLPLGGGWESALYGGVGVGVSVACDVRINETSQVSCTSGLSSPKTEWTIPLGARLGYPLAGGSRLLLDARYSVPVSEALEVQSFRILTWHFLLRWSTAL
ncbi:MAG: hypothetical protein PVI01_11650 [Gemmatimonadales bacterium]|jgi:hypothetical protein